ncbi:unnamed protein product [Calypogeia fissa]
MGSYMEFLDSVGLAMHTAVLLVAGSSALLCLHFTSTLLSRHLYFWKNPEQQRLICIIIMMAPLYSLTSFVGLVEFKASEAFFTILESIRECYEALVIASFLNLLYSYMNVSPTTNFVPDEIKGPVIHHSFPITLFQPHEVKLDQKTLKLLQQWTWQFVIIRPAVSILIVTLELLDLYEGPIVWLCSITLNLSVSLAMYSLITFYHVFNKELAPHGPLLKIICIKGVVFFSFWQGVVLSMLAYTGVIRTEHRFLELAQIEEAYQNLFVCLEMVVFGVLQQYAFSTTEYSGDTEKMIAAGKARHEKKDR